MQQKKSMKRRETKPAVFYLTLEAQKNTYGKPVSVTAKGISQSQPTLESNQASLKVRMDIPVDLFTSPEVNIHLAMDQLVPDEMIAEVESWIVEE